MQVLDDKSKGYRVNSDDTLTLFSDNLRIDIVFNISSNKEYGTDFDVYAKFSFRSFYRNEKKISLEEKLSVLSSYENFLKYLKNSDFSNLLDNNSIKRPESYSDSHTAIWKKNPITYFKNIISQFRNIFDEVQCISTLLRDIRAMHITTYMDGSPFIKTTIELDGDVFNVISPTLKKENYAKTFALHVCNMKYASYVTQKKIQQFFNNINPITKFVGRFASMAYLLPWIVIEILNISTTANDFGLISVADTHRSNFLYILSDIFANNSGDSFARIYDTIFRICTQIFGIPFLIFKLAPRLIIKTIKHKIF